jgi:NAD(P)-dependent dehydrogenase (short-subunit alcohol dehydrogenase family)
MNPLLTGKTALVTGATSGIGRATALRFVQEGARVAAIGRKTAALDALVKQAGVGRIVPIVADLAQADARVAAVEHARRELSGIDVLVNAAGILESGSLETTDLARFDRSMDVNVRVAFDLMRLVLADLVARKGNVVNVSSVTGTRAFPGVIAYCVSKAAVDQLTRCAALELAPRGVRVNAVNPGVVTTGLHKSGGMTDDAYAAFLEHSKETHPLGRVGKPEEVAALIAFLASDQAGWITAATMPIDGGRAETCAR